MFLDMYDVIVIGAGASGSMAAISALYKGSSVLLCEADEKLHRKLLTTGNGRCNLSNSIIEKDWLENKKPDLGDSRLCASLAYRNFDFAKHALLKMGCNDTRKYFKILGLETFEDNEGRIYPITNKARTVSNILSSKFFYKYCGNMIHLEKYTEIIEISRHNKIWTCRSSDGKLFHSKSVILATGGAFGLAKNLGLNVLEAKPVLGPVFTKNSLSKKLNGIRTRCVATLKRKGKKILSLPGEVLFRKYGLSGIVIFELSRFVECGDVISLDIMPWFTHEELTDNINERITGALCDPDLAVSCEDVLEGLLQTEVSDALLEEIGADPYDFVLKFDRKKMVGLLKNLEFEVTKGVNHEGAQCIRGGIAVSEIDPQTMSVASSKYPNLFACGEIINVDGTCGGFNLQWAWSSGYLAGKSAAIAAQNFDEEEET